MAEVPPQAASMRPVYHRLVRYAARRRLALAAVGLTMLLSIGMNLLRPWPMALIVDSVLGSKTLPRLVEPIFIWLPGGVEPRDLLLWAIIGTFVVFLLGWLLSLASSLANISFGRRIQYDLAADVLLHLQRLSLRYHSRRGAGDLIRRIAVDSECVTVIVKDALLPVVTSVVSLVAMFLVMFAIDWRLTLASLLVTPAMLFFMRRYSRPMADRDYEQQQVEGEVYDVVERTLSGINTVQAFGGEQRESARFSAAANRVLQATLRATAAQLHFKVRLGAATALGAAAVMYIGGRGALAGELSIGEILVFLTYLRGLYTPLEALVYTSATLQGAAGSAVRVIEVLDTAPEVSDGPLPLEGRARGHVRFESVSFSYDPGSPVLHDVSFDARPGQLVALVGATGAGKSTVAGLIVRFFDPDSGRVLLDGQDLRQHRVYGLRSQVALVLQESFLFPIAIADNIAYGRPGASREEIVSAATAANAHDFIQAMPDGYDTVVGERGGTLSGGQRQRIAIARALLKDAPVLVLDEPTSALDGRTEALLMDAVDGLMVGRTSFVIAHRLSTIERADQILVLDQGRVAEAGTHAELMSSGGLYARMYALNAGGRPHRSRPAPVTLP